MAILVLDQDNLQMSNLFSGKNKNSIRLSSSESAQRVVKVKAVSVESVSVASALVNF